MRKSFFVRKNTLLILRTDAIGDYILFRNFIKILKESERFKNYRITLLGNKIWKELAEEYDSKYIDKFIWIDTINFFKKSDWIETYLLLLKIHIFGYDTVLVPNDTLNWRSEFIVSHIGSKNIIMKKNDLFFQGNISVTESNNWISSKSDYGQKSVFQFYRNKSFIEEITQENCSLEKPCFENFRETTEIDNKKEPYIVLFPGASDIKKKWSSENFGILCSRINSIMQVKFLICGNRNDRKAAEKIIEISGIKNIVDKTRDESLVELVDLISKAELLITNDTCALHIGASLNIKTICISNGLHFGRFHPYPVGMPVQVITFYPDYELYGDINYVLLAQKYHLDSKLNINNISANDVLKYVEEIYSSCNEEELQVKNISSSKPEKAVNK